MKNQIETNSIVLDLWNKTKTEFIANDSIEFVSKINLITSTYISSPLTIGVFDKTTIVVLPVYDYSQNELLMIFHHEINHIIARDNKTKLILNLYKSIFWFNPIIHFALKENAVNLEMRCDENTVKSSRCSKKEYLSLIINTAASNSAITSSLIADKKSLEYRIKNITQKTEKKNTIILTLIIFIVVTSTIGSLNLVYDQKACFINNDGGLELAYDSIVFNNGESIEKCNIDNIEELTNNISSLNAFRIAGIKRVRESNYISLIAKNGNKTYQLYITDNFIQSIDMNFILRSYVYYCPGLEIETLLKK